MISTCLPLPRASVMPPCLPEVSTASRSMSDRGDRILAEFEQHASGSGRMYEDVQVPASADFDFVGDEPHALALEVLESCGDVVHVDRDVMEAFAALRNEFIDNGIF